MSKHTPEPWNTSNGRIYQEGKKQSTIATVAKDFQDYMIFNEDDARRIVACVNALAGLTTEQIEDGAFAKMRDDRDFLLKQNSEMLEALEGVASSGRGSSGRIILDSFDEQCVVNAITKAKGGAA